MNTRIFIPRAGVALAAALALAATAVPAHAIGLLLPAIQKAHYVGTEDENAESQWTERSRVFRTESR